MRFIFNFIFFGILFFLIYIYFPEAFKTLVSWVQAIYDFFAGLINSAIEKSGMRKGSPSPEGPKQIMALLQLFL